MLVQVVKLLLSLPSERGVDPTADNNYAIRCASHNGHLDVVKLLLTYPKVDPTADDNYAIQWASHNGHLEVAKLLLTLPKVDPSADDNYAIRSSSRMGHLEVVKLLLTLPKVDPSADDNAAIRCASRNGNLDVVKLLLTRPEVDPGARNNAAIHEAGLYGHREVIEVLKEHSRMSGMNKTKIVKNDESMKVSVVLERRGDLCDSCKTLRGGITSGGIMDFFEIVETIKNCESCEALKNDIQSKESSKKSVKYNLKTIKNCKYITEDGDPHLVITFL